MFFDFDTLMTAFWNGFACISASLISRRESVIALLIFWCALFPSLENMVREVLRAFFRPRPADLWSLAVAAASSYLLAACIAAFRFARHSRKSRHA
jgi:hypothetical protein